MFNVDLGLPGPDDYEMQKCFIESSAKLIQSVKLTIHQGDLQLPIAHLEVYRYKEISKVICSNC